MTTKNASPPLKPELVQAISKKVSVQFPEIAGKKPRVRRQKISNGRGKPEDRNFLLVYRAHAVGPGGKKIPRFVRVVVNPAGKILKMSTSRG